jgi:hypothetical protein
MTSPNSLNVYVNVRAADAAGPDADQNFPGCGRYILYFRQPQVFRTIVNECFHRHT